MPALRRVRRNLGVSGRQFATFDFPVLARVGGLNVSDTDLVDLSSFASITSMGSLALGDNPMMTALGGPLDTITSLPGGVTLALLPLITDLDELAGVTVLGSVAFRSMDLVDVSGLGNATGIRSVDISDCDGLVSLTGLEGATSLSRLQIEYNDALETIDAVADAASDGQTEIAIRNNPVLTGLTLPAITSAEYVFIWSNPAITQVTMSSLAVSEREVIIHDDAAMATVDLPALATAGDRFSVSYNPSLTAVAVPSLVDITGADSQLSFYQDPLFPICDAWAIHDQLVAAGWDGESWGERPDECPPP